MTHKATIRCCAKVNFFLDVLCKRPDGYHNIETVFQSVSLHDEIEIKLVATGLSVHCDAPSVPADKTNLAAVAYLAFAEAVDYGGGIEITIRKSIPAGAGLGGGSSNAAGMLAGLNQLLRPGLPERELRDIASGIGADVPFFLSGGLAAAWGIGDKIRLLPPLPETYMVIAIPKNLMVSTAAAYNSIRVPACGRPAAESLFECTQRFRGVIDVLNSVDRTADRLSLDSMLYNAFEESIFRLCPGIERIKTALLEAGAQGALMSGSGSAVFGLCGSQSHAQRIGDIVSHKCGCQCFVAGTVNHGWEIDEK